MTCHPRLCLQCHEACIAIYSSMENQKLSHWVWISTLSMLFCLLVYTLTGASHWDSSSAAWDCLQPPTTAPPLSVHRCLRLPDLWTGGRRRYSDVLSRQRRGDDHLQTALRNLHRHHLPHYSAPGEVGATAGPSRILPPEFLTAPTQRLTASLLNRSVILNLVLRLQRHRRGVVTHSFESRCRVILTVVWISVTVLTAMFVPDMSKVISVIGGISAFFIFIFPGG